MDYKKTEKYIEPLRMNGLHGRMMRRPAPKGKLREILLIYGHHSSLERMSGFAEVLNRYGAVTMPDLPGFGGMESFYKINEKPTIDTYADYLAAFVKLRYKRRRVTIVGMSFAVPIIVRMLQRYPKLAKKVDFVISTVGFVHKDDFIFSKSTYWALRFLSWFGSHKLPSEFLRIFVLRRFVIWGAYSLVRDRHTKLKDADRLQLKKRIEFETRLWKINDVRTRLSTLNMMLNMDVCDRAVNVSMFHVAPTEDRYFNSKVVEQHMRIIFDNLEVVETKMPSHAPSIIATAKEAAPYVPRQLQRILSK
jgi:pimeloyl-ACP methyl ester carboxylesterase